MIPDILAPALEFVSKRQVRWFKSFYAAAQLKLTLHQRWNDLAGVGYAFHWGEITGVWRYLDYDLESGSPMQSLTLSGPAIGATFRF